MSALYRLGRQLAFSAIAFVVMVALLSFFASVAHAAITATALTDGGNATDANSYTTASITPTANNLILAWVTNTKATLPDPPTLSGNGLTWVQFASVTWGTTASPTAQTTVYRAMGAAPSSGAVTISFGGIMQTGAAWSIVEFSGVDPGNPVRQGIPGSTDSATAAAGLSITLSPLYSALNATAGGFSNRVNTATSISPGTGYTASAGVAYATPATSIRSEWKTAGSTTVNVTQSATSHIGGVAVEINADLCPGFVVTTTTDTPGTLGSLRECIRRANSLPGSDTITFSAGVFNPGTITVTPGMPLGMGGFGTIIDGGNAANVILDGAGAAANGLSFLGLSSSNQIKNLTIQNFTSYGITSAAGGTSNSHLISNNVLKTNGIDGVFLQGVSNSTISNNTVNNNTNRGVRIGVSSSGNTLSNNQIYSNGGPGVALLNVTGNTVEGNTIYSNGATQAIKNGIYIDNAGTNNNVIRTNLIRNNAGTGILVGSAGIATTGTKIYHNTIHANTGDGIQVGTSATGTIIQNNILTSNTAWGVNTGVAATFGTNDYFGNTTGACTGTGCNGAGSITTDPLYVNAAGNNYNLTTCTSPAINSGADLGADQPDLNGASAGNYNGPLPDMGAYESSCNTTTLGDGTTPSNKTVALSSTNNAVSSFTLATSSGTDTVTALTVTRSGTGTAADVAASGVKIYQDNGTTANEWDASDTLIASASFSGATASFTGLSVGVTTSASQYLITYDIAAGATGGNTLLAAVTAATITNSLLNNDNADATLTVSPTCNVTNTNDSGAGSLRECINTANGTPGTTIRFNIPGPGNQSAGANSWWRITPLTWLPGFIASNTIIDGTTQTANRGNTNSLGPEIEINGATVGGVGLDGFGVSSPANNVTIRGFIINQWSGAGISLWTGTGTVTGNYIGTNYAGTAALANTNYGIYVNSNGNTIGGTTAAARNVIAGNSGPGIRIVGNSNTVQGNYIGVNATAGGVLPNASDGIQITATATGNTLGGTVAGAGNVISGNTGGGISNISSGSNSVQGNTIGTNASSASLPNGGDGLYTSAGTINLGNASEVQSNIIGPNTGVGINLAGGAVNLAGTVTVNDDATLSTGTLSMGSATLNVSGNWTRTSATVTPGTSTVNLNGTTNQTITSGGASFFNLTLNNTGAAGSDKAITSGTLTTSGALTVTDGTLDIGTNNPAVNTAGNVTISTAGSINVTGRTGTAWTFNGTSTFTDSSSTGPQQLGSITVGGSSSILNLASSMKVWSMSINAGNTANLGSGGYTLEITIGGTPLSNAGTFTAGISTVRYTGYLAGVTVAPNVTFNSLELAPGGAGTYSLGNATTVTGNLTIGANTTFTTTNNNYALNVAGNWSNSGTFVANGGTVTLNGTNQTINGNTTFNNFTKSVAAADTLTFASAATQTVNGLLTLNGASGQLLSLRASTPGNAANLTLAGGGTQAISYVDVKDNNAGGGLTLVAPNSIDSLNNTNWDFGLTSAPLTKQVWDIAGNCLASSNTSGGVDSCNGNAASATVPSGTAVKFLIYIRNTSAVAMSDVRFQDLLDISGTGFTYSTGTLQYSNSQTDAATITSIYTATNGGTAQTDALGAPDDVASYVTGTLSVGAVAGQANQSVSIPGKRTFAILFQVVKN